MVRSGAVLVASLLVGWVATSSASAATRVVDDDLRHCPAAQYQTIQAAVAASGAGDRISVCAGQYRERVYIPPGKDGLVVEATPRRAAVLRAPASFAPNPRLRAIVVAAAQNAVVRGLRILGPLPAGTCDEGFTHDAGVQIGAAGVLIEDNQISAVADNCNRGNGIWAGDAQDELGLQFGAASAVVRANLIDGYRQAGVVVENTIAAGRVLITGNEIAGAQTRPQTIGVEGGQEGTLAVEGNLIHSNAVAGVRLYGAFAGDHVVRGNRIRGNGIGVDANQEGGSLIAGNDVSANRSFGIRSYVQFNSADQILDNLVRDNGGHGIALLLGGGTVAGNQSLRNLGDGIRVEGGGFALDHNTALGSRGVDCRDTTGPGGPGTAGTFNTWTANRGRTSSPPGLCLP